MPKTFGILVAVCLFLIGTDSRNVPIVDPQIWPPIYFGLSAMAVWMTVRPDQTKLRLITAGLIATGLFRGLLYVINENRLGPLAFHLLIALLAYGYWQKRRLDLPPTWDDDRPDWLTEDFD